MKIGISASLLLLGSGVLASCAEIELTGLVEIGGCRMACFRLAPGGEYIALRKGETSRGVTVEELNARSGWALFDFNGAPVRARLSNFCSVRSAVPAQKGEISSSSFGLSDQALPYTHIQVRQSDAPGSRSELSPEPASPLSLGLFGRTQAQPPASSGGQTIAPENSTSGQPLEAEKEPVLDQDPIMTTPTHEPGNDRRRAYEAALQSDPVYQEGEQVKLLYGLQGFLAWDVQRGQAQLEGK